jgi:hypothetical protein
VKHLREKEKSPYWKGLYPKVMHPACTLTSSCRKMENPLPAQDLLMHHELHLQQVEEPLPDLLQLLLLPAQTKGQIICLTRMSSLLQIRVIKQRAVKLSSSSSVQKTVEKKSSIWKDYNEEF